MRAKLKKWSKPFLEEHSSINLSKDKMELLLKNNNQLHIEIGSGKGDFITGMAIKNPDLEFIGVEFVPSVASVALKKVVEQKINNVKIYNGDVNDLFVFINDNSVMELFLNFSDPWPKKRHEKRRLTSPLFLKQYHRMLNIEGVMYLKTDNKDFFDYSYEQILTNGFKILEYSNDYQLQQRDVMTEYEAKFRSLNTKINYLKAVKI